MSLQEKLKTKHKNKLLKMQKSIWIFRTLAGALSAFLEYLYFSSSNFSPMTLFIAKMAVLIICVVFGLVLIRKLLGGSISVARTLLSGSLISLTRAIVMIGVFLFLYYPSGEFYQPKIQEALQIAENKVMADENIKDADKEEEIRITQADITPQFKPLGYSGIAIASSLITGLIISVLVAAFISTNMMYKE